MERQRAIAGAFLLGLAGLLLAGATPAAAQQPRGGTVQGRVVGGEAAEPLGAANVVLRLPDDTDDAAATVTDAAGPRNGTSSYHLVIRAPGLLPPTSAPRRLNPAPPRGRAGARSQIRGPRQTPTAPSSRSFRSVQPVWAAKAGRPRAG